MHIAKRFDALTYPYGATSQTCPENTFFTFAHQRMWCFDATWPIHWPGKMALYDWTKDETECFSRVIKGKNITIILSSKQAKTNIILKLIYFTLLNWNGCKLQLHFVKILEIHILFCENLSWTRSQWFHSIHPVSTGTLIVQFAQFHTSSLGSWRARVAIIVDLTQKNIQNSNADCWKILPVWLFSSNFLFPNLLFRILCFFSLYFFTFFLLDAHQSISVSNQSRGRTSPPPSKAFVPATWCLYIKHKRESRAPVLWM